MAAAALGGELGLDTVLIDEQDSPGGQIYRAIERTDGDRGRNSPLGADYLAGRPLAAALRASPVQYRPGTTVWHIDPGDAEGGGSVSVVAREGSETIACRRILLATGAIERPVPIPGWTLPGVMTAGAAQILLKTADLVPAGRTVIAGQGPLLYLAAIQLARAGAPPLAVLETTPRENYAAAARHIGGWRRGRRDVATGLAMIAGLRRLGLPVRRGVRGLRASGRRRVEGVAWDGGEIAADLLLLHDGVIPNAQISLALQLAHVWDGAQLCWRPVVDQWGRTSLPTVAIAGDAAGIAGAAAAPLAGRLAALDAAHLAGSHRRGGTRPQGGAAACRVGARTRVATVSRRALSPGERGAVPGQRRRHRLPLRRGHGRPDPPRRPPRRARAEPGESVYPLRHGAVSGPHLRSGRERHHRPHPRRADRRGRRVPPPRAIQADLVGDAGRDRATPGGARRTSTAHCHTSGTVMLTDGYGLRVSTNSTAARDAYVEGCRAKLTMYPGALEAFDRAIAADPGFALAHAARAHVLLERGDAAAARASIAAANSSAAALSAREAGHVAFFDLLVAGETEAALAALLAHLEAWPRDAVALGTTAFTNGLIGSSGRAGQKRMLLELLERLAPS